MYGSVCKVPGECRGIEGNVRGKYGSGQKVPEECRRIQGNAMERMRGCKVQGECRGMPSKLKAVGEKCQGNAGKYSEIPRERIGSACKPPEECREMPGECKSGWTPQGNAAECSQENVWKLVQSDTLMQGNDRGIHGIVWNWV